MNDIAYSESSESIRETDLIDLLGILRRRKWWILCGIALGVLAAFAYLKLTPPTYRSEMEILVGQKSGDLVNGASASNSVEGSDADEDTLSTHIQLLTSRRIVKAAIEGHNLESIPSVQEVVAEGGSSLNYVLSNLGVSKGGDGVARDAHTLKASYTDPSAEDCATILRAIYDEYENYLTEHFAGTSNEAVELLSQLANETGDEVKASEKQLADHMSSSSLMWDGEKTRNIHKERLAKIEDDLHSLTETEAETESRLAVISDFLETNDPDSITDGDRFALLSSNEVSRLQLMLNVSRGDGSSESFQADQPIRQANARAEYEEYLELVMREKKLRETFSDGHPLVVSVQEQIALMRDFIDEQSAKLNEANASKQMSPAEMLESYVGLLENDLAGLTRQREILQRRSELELAKAKELEKAEMQAESLRRELTRRQQVFDNAQATLKELNFVRDYAGFSTDVIGDAEKQTHASWPKPTIVLALGLFSGCLLGLGAALVIDLMDTTFADPEDVQRSLGAPVMAHVPRFEPMKVSKRDPPLLIDDSIRVHHQPRNPAAEAFRVLRTGLLIEAKAKGHQVLQVTSPLPGDGKSTTSVNLAMAFAQTGKRILLIDADLRKPRVGKLLHLDGEFGLSEALSDLCKPTDVLQPTVNENLFAVSAGSIPPNPSELLQSERFTQLLNVWRDMFDFVIIDTPPVLAVSDAAVVSEQVDNILLAVRIVANKRRAAERAVEILRQNDSQIGAIVVNGYQAKNSNYGYTGRYDSDTYGYGYGESNRSYYGESDRSVQSA